MGSGGFRGPAHIGVLKVLEKNKIPIDFLTGSSIGALIAAHYALHKDIDKLIKDFFILHQQSVKLLSDFSTGGGLINGKRLENFFKKTL